MLICFLINKLGQNYNNLIYDKAHRIRMAEVRTPNLNNRETDVNCTYVMNIGKAGNNWIN